ncbi:MAG TPA: alkaline phosphatase PhoX, partial [Candidatus Lustribacter sp.]|nr:alkaline phosphatase PhoX [Candidatus Lustribacter sp.]
RTHNGTQVLMNHELASDKGIVRRHGQEGSFVSKVSLDRTGRVVKAEDFITSVRYFSFGSFGDGLGTYQATPVGTDDARFNRFCSSTLAAAGSLYNRATGRGTTERIYFANEEGNDESRVFGVDESGHAVELPRLGRFATENSVPAAHSGNTTVVMGNEDGATTTSELRVYVGKKERGFGKSPFAKAGLQNGTSHVIAVTDGVGGLVPSDAAFRAAYGKGDKVRFSLSEVPWDATGAAQNAEADVEGTSFDRIEDGQWDPRKRNVYYFVTTQGGEGTVQGAGNGGGGGLWRLTYDDVRNPSAGGTLELLLDGTEAINLVKPDNMTIDGRGNILLQEDPGNIDAVARIAAYRIADGALGQIATFDPALFTPGAPRFLTKDEESSGIIDLEPLGYPAGTFLFDAQVHTDLGLPADPDPAADNPGTADEYVERGQLLKLGVADFRSVYTILPVA